jgi:hypothetical protein
MKRQEPGTEGAINWDITEQHRADDREIVCSATKDQMYISTC